jgi:hypothetical protein
MMSYFLVGSRQSTVIRKFDFFIKIMNGVYRNQVEIFLYRGCADERRGFVFKRLVVKIPNPK